MSFFSFCLWFGFYVLFDFSFLVFFVQFSLFVCFCLFCLIRLRLFHGCNKKGGFLVVSIRGRNLSLSATENKGELRCNWDEKISENLLVFFNFICSFSFSLFVCR